MDSRGTGTLSLTSPRVARCITFAELPTFGYLKFGRPPAKTDTKTLNDLMLVSSLFVSAQVSFFLRCLARRGLLNKEPGCHLAGGGQRPRLGPLTVAVLDMNLLKFKELPHMILMVISDHLVAFAHPEKDLFRSRRPDSSPGYATAEMAAHGMPYLSQMHVITISSPSILFILSKLISLSGFIGEIISESTVPALPSLKAIISGCLCNLQLRRIRGSRKTSQHFCSSPRCRMSSTALARGMRTPCVLSHNRMVCMVVSC
jgi:hypothetical protein